MLKLLKKRYVALDFETTGLDILKDEIIQIGVVVCDENFQVIESYSQLVKPRKDIKELKHIVGFITGLSLKDLEHAPSIEETLKEWTHLIDENSILIGQNIGFDVSFLEKVSPETKFFHSIDTFTLAQNLIHYPGSYALEVVCGREEVKKSVSFLSQQAKGLGDTVLQYHDALSDSFASMGLFRFCFNKIQRLCEQYPGLDKQCMKSKYFQSFCEKEKTESNNDGKTFVLPLLQKTLGGDTKPVVGESIFAVDKLASLVPYYTGKSSFGDALSSFAVNGPVICAFHTRQKIDIAKAYLQEKGYHKLGFAKEEQRIDMNTFNQLIEQDVFADFESLFVVRYCSHHDQGLRVLDLNSQESYKVYHLIKSISEKKVADIVLCSHSGLYSMIKEDAYKNHRVAFFDPDRWYVSYNKYISQRVDLQYLLGQLETLYYVYRRRDSFGVHHAKQVYQKLQTFIQSYTVFIGIVGMEITDQFRGSPQRKKELGPIIGHQDFRKSSGMWDSLVQSFEEVVRLLEEHEQKNISLQWKRIVLIFSELCVVEQRMQDNRFLNYSFNIAQSYTDYHEFTDQFAHKQVHFLSHYKKENKAIPYLNETDTDKANDKITETQKKTGIKKIQLSECRDIKRIEVLINSLEKIKEPEKNKRIFIVSSVKKQSREMFERFSQSKALEGRDFFVENITGGMGKNIHKTQDSEQCVIVGGYYFLLSLFAKKVTINTIVVYNLSGPMKKLIESDIVYYGSQ